MLFGACDSAVGYLRSRPRDPASKADDEGAVRGEEGMVKDLGRADDDGAEAS